MDLGKADKINPLNILNKSGKLPLKKGDMGVLLSNAGVGKSACLVQIGLNELLHEKRLLHIATNNVQDVQAQFSQLTNRLSWNNPNETYGFATKFRMIKTYPYGQITPDRLEDTIKTCRQLHFEPDLIILDGVKWENTQGAIQEVMGQFKKLAERFQTGLWFTARTRQIITGESPTKLPSPCNECADLISIALFLQPEENSVILNLLEIEEKEMGSNFRVNLSVPDMLIQEVVQP